MRYSSMTFHHILPIQNTAYEYYAIELSSKTVELSSKTRLLTEI